MKKSLIVLIGSGALLVVFGSWFAISAKSSDEAEILRIETQTSVGEQQNDISMMHFFADDYIAAAAKVLTKKQFEENVKQNFATHENGINPYTIEKKNIQIYIFGDTAVATYLKEYRQIGESSHAFTEDDTDILTRAPNGWVIRMTRLSRPTS
jgi:ketosteroid isomerase-like protein